MNIDQKEFEQLWEQAALKPFIDEMSDGFPLWQRRRRQRRNRLMGFAAICLVGGTVLLTTLRTDKCYDSIASNRTDVVDEYWLQIANDMLITKV